jgi:hypothetical protein
MRTSTHWIATLALALAVTACNRDEPFGPGLDSVASLSVQAYFEYDDNTGFGGGDAPAPGVPIQVVFLGTDTPVVEAVADAQGTVDFPSIPVGTYDIRVEPTFLGDSLVVAAIDSTRVTFAPNQARTFRVGLTPPTLSVAQVRALPLGRRVWITGMALNTRPTSLDGAVHVLEDGVNALRVNLPAASGGAQGDSVRALGTTAGTGSGRYLVDGRINVLAQDVRPLFPLELSISEARTAGGGQHAARLVVIRGGQVTDTTTIPFVGLRVGVRDGGATINVMLPQQNGFGTPPLPAGTPVVSVRGLLVQDPDAAGAWRIVPLRGGDVSFGPPPAGG